MVWKSWGTILLLFAFAAPLLCSAADGDVSVSFSKAPPRLSRSTSAAFAFQVVDSNGGPCQDCAITCKLDGERESGCGRNGNNGTTVVMSYARLKDGNHTFAACAEKTRGRRRQEPTCANYAWDVDTIAPTASVTAESGFTSASNVSVLVSFSEPCPGAGGFTCNSTYCDLIVYGPGRVEPSTLQVLRPGLHYSVDVTISPELPYGRLFLVMARGFCTDAAGHHFIRTANSTFTLRFGWYPPFFCMPSANRRSDSMSIGSSIPEKMLQIEGATRVVEATNDDRELKIYLSFAEPVMNSSLEILAALSATDAVLTPTNRSTLGNRRFGYLVKRTSNTAVVTVSCDGSSIISRQGTPVFSSEPYTFLYDNQRPSVKLATSTVRTSSRNIPVLIKFAKPVFNFSSSAVKIQAVDNLVSVQVAENSAQDVAGNTNLASDSLEVRHYSVPASSSLIAIVTTVIFAVTAAIATLLTVSTSSLLASGAIQRPSSYIISEPSRNLLRMACHIQVFALSRWLSINLPVEYYELSKGLEWSIPYMRLPWEGPSADPFVGYSTMPAIAYSELLDRSAVAGRPSHPAGVAMPMPMPSSIEQQQSPLEGKPLTAMEYRYLLENQDMKPEAQIIMKLQDLDGWKYLFRNIFWLAVIGGAIVLLHAAVLVYLKVRHYHRRRVRRRENDGGEAVIGYGALVLPRAELMVAVLAMPCVSQAAAALIRGGTTAGLGVGIVLTGVLTSFMVALVLFLSVGVTTGRLLQYKEVRHESSSGAYHQEIARRTLGPGKRGQWTWKDPGRATWLVKLGPLFEDLRGPPKYMVSQIAAAKASSSAEERIMASEDENEDTEAPLLQKVFGILRIYYTVVESVKRVALGIVAGAHASSDRSSRAHAVVVLAIASFQLFFILLKKPFIRKRVQLVEIVSVAAEVFVFAACLRLIDDTTAAGDVDASNGLGLAMLGVFALAIAAQVGNEWNALYRQVRMLSPDRSSFTEGAKAAWVGLLLLVLPSSALGDRLDRMKQQQQPAAGTAAQLGGGVEAQRSWLGQLREMAKASFSRDGGGGDQASGSRLGLGKKQAESMSSVASSSDSKAKPDQWSSKSKGLYKDLEAIFSDR
uniref:Bacterial Ig-like domain-containing protein n=1 Tax=Leersia perrieri TaxID=77586 RepID=A0A0D9WKK1_9ORYZ